MSHRGWSHRSAVRSMYCSSRGPKVSSQHPQSQPQTRRSLASVGVCTYVHTDTQCTQWGTEKRRSLQNRDSRLHNSCWTLKKVTLDHMLPVIYIHRGSLHEKFTQVTLHQMLYVTYIYRNPLHERFISNFETLIQVQLFAQFSIPRAIDPLYIYNWGMWIYISLIKLPCHKIVFSCEMQYLESV